jgi:hypothetical protein
MLPETGDAFATLVIGVNTNSAVKISIAATSKTPASFKIFFLLIFFRPP